MKIAFLHPYKMREHFFVEAIEAAIVADLRACGHDAEAVEYLFDARRSEDEQVSELSSRVAEGRYDVIFLERPWSDEMVRALSGERIVGFGRPDLVEKGLVTEAVAAPSREVVRAFVGALSRSSPVDEIPGLVVRRGDAIVHTSAIAPMSVAAELRDASFDYASRSVLSASAANADRAVVVANLGCAYRNATNRTGVFDGVAMPADVSTAGCTFCDVEPYERMTEADAVALIVRQISAVLRDRPGIRQIAVKDDYALRYLARLGEALRPLGLGDREIFLSTRADYLLHHEGDIERALSSDFPAPLGFYLIGFENFSQAELERFNKGMTGAEIERVVELMRGWAARFPGRFRTSPTGGFILFTPWTTVEDLRINAAAIRRLGFNDFRGQSLLSKLRLYPNLPLYWLAKRDGLLVDAFAREDMSDARRRGYEADHGWRFRDERVARVNERLLDAAKNGDRDLSDALDAALDEAEGIEHRRRDGADRAQRRPRVEAAVHAVPLNRACDQACRFCSSRGEDREAPRARAARAIARVKEAARAGAALLLGGAEPTLEWYLDDLIRLARSLGITEVALETNGMALSEPGRATALAEAGLTRAVVAFNSLDPLIADHISLHPGGHAQTEAGIRALLDAGIPVELAVALLPENRGALASIVEGAAAHFPAGRAQIEGILARFIAAPAAGPSLAVRDAAAELEAGARASASSPIALRVAPGSELPPCVFDDPIEAAPALRLGEALAERERASYRRIPACARCAALRVCPGVTPILEARVAEAARALSPDAVPLNAAGERRAIAPKAVASPPRDEVWETIGLAPFHRLREGSAAALDAAEALPMPPRSWAERAGGPVDVEALQLEGGLRALVKREHVSLDEAQQMADAFTRRGLAVGLYQGPSGSASDKRTVFVARDAETVDEALRIEPGIAGSWSERATLVRRMGALLGYPACCAGAFAGMREQDDATHLERLSREQVAALEPEQNWAVISLRLFSHFPCRASCPATAELARATLGLVRAANPAFASSLRAALASVALVSTLDRFVLLPGARQEGPDVFRYEEVLSHHNLGMDEGVSKRRAFRAFHLEVISVFERGDRVARAGDSLIVTRGARPVGRIDFASPAPRLLDFTGRAPRRLPLAQPGAS